MLTRTALAVVLLMDDSGLRRDEVAGARRSGLVRWNGRVWFLRILGKRNKLRDVPVSDRTVAALRAQWADRNLDFDRGDADHPLVRPVTIPDHATALVRHAEGTDNGYTANGLYRVVTAALRRARAELSARHPDGGELDELDLAVLGRTTPHAFRHTYGTLATEAGMPLDVVQSVLGHASGTTTSIYVRAKQKRMAEEAEKYHGTRE